VSRIISYFAAPDDASAAAALFDSVPESEFETLTCGNFDALAALLEWESILTGQDIAELETPDHPRVVAEHESDPAFCVFAASPEFQAALAAADRATLDDVAHRWVAEYGDRYWRVDPALFAVLLGELSDLVRSALAQDLSVYCWMC